MNISIIGQGNVATHLAKAFSSRANVTSVNSRTLQGLPTKSDIYIIAVADSAIPDVAQAMIGVDGMVVHTSGTSAATILKPYFSRYGVFYPLQTFSKEVSLDYSSIPVFIESAPEDGTLLRECASLFTTSIYEADSTVRMQMHIAAVFSCNFVNALLGIGADIMHQAELPFELLHPLLRQTIEKAFSLKNPSDGQTGPAVRYDYKTLCRHILALQSNPDREKIYNTLTNYIMNRHECN